MNNSSKDLTCWIVTEGMVGTENQCLGVADALGLSPVVKRIALNEPWASLTPYLGFEGAWCFKEPLIGPWPDLLLASGRKAVAAARYIKKASDGKTFTVFIQNPKTPANHFDLVAIPSHDSLAGDNVITTLGAPNRMTVEALAQAKAQFPKLSALKGPKVAVLIGGNSKAYAMTAEITTALCNTLSHIDASLMITASRRTGPENEKILHDAFKDAPEDKAFIWNGEGDNPYLAMLAHADTILVTADSTSMLSDAVSTGKSTYIIPLDGGARRIDNMHKNLIDHGAARWFEGKFEQWNYPAVEDAKTIATEIKRRMCIQS